VLVAEDDADDRFLLESAFDRSDIDVILRFVPDGEELMDYLKARGGYRDESTFPRPHLILLDLNMPRKDGRTALAEIRREASFNDLPIIVVTTSSARRDRDYCTQHGVLDYVNKPTSVVELHYLLDIVKKVCTNEVRGVS
jgi:CheY-like chemotaxis protein